MEGPVVLGANMLLVKANVHYLVKANIGGIQIPVLNLIYNIMT